MITIDGKPLDLSTPLPPGVTIKPGGYIEQCKNGIVTRLDYPTDNATVPDRTEKEVK